MALSPPSSQRRGEADRSRTHSAEQDRQDGLLPVVKFLQSALAMKAKGDGHHYQHLVAQLLTRDDPETLWRLYLGLSECVTIISQEPEEFKELIDALFRFDWRGSQKIVQSFGGLLSHLVSANSTCMVPAMHMLIRNLVLHPRDLDAEGNVDPAALTRQHNVHASLQATLTLVPSGRSKLFGVLKQNYPHRRLRAEILSDFAFHALRVVQYAPLIEESVLRLIIEKSLEIDVEIKIMDTGEAVIDDEDEESDALFTMDDLADGTADAKKENTDEVDEMADKLDGVMLVVFTYLDQRLTANASLPPEQILETPLQGSAAGAEGDGPDGAGGPEGRHGEAGGVEGGRDGGRRSSMGGSQGMESVARLLKSLLLVFEESILPTHRSKFVQFVLFFASGRAHGLGYALTSKLVEVLRDDSRPKLVRQSSVAYLASFLARGSFVDASLVSTAVQSLLDWAGQYLDQHGDGFTAPLQTTFGTPGSKAFQTPVASRVRARPQSWHGTKPTESAGAHGDALSNGGTMPAPMSAMSAARAGVGAGSAGSSSSKSRAMADHMLFYSVCQATFYVMCFRGDELAAMDGFRNKAAIWQRLLTCPLYPLRRCLDTVRREFARLCCGLMEDYLDPDLLEHLEGISEERPQVTQQTISVGSSFSCSTPRSASSNSMSMSMSSNVWTPARVTKAGGLGRGSNPLDSFFPFDPYLLRRSHAYIDSLYNTWTAQDDNAASRRRLRRRRKKDSSRSSARTPVDGRHRLDGACDSESCSGGSDVGSSGSSSGADGSLSSSSLSSSEEDHGGGGRNFDAMDAGSLSYRDGASGGLLARSRRAQQRENKGKKKNRGGGGSSKTHAAAGDRSGGGGQSSQESSSGEEDDGDAEARRMSRKMADTYITESMSVTPGSSVAVGSLMGTSLGQAMSSSFADDGMVWAAAGAGGVAGTPDDAFFHENVSPCASPPLESSSALGRRSTPALDIRGRSDRALF